MATELTTEHQFVYDTQGPVTAKMLAESLLGLEGVAKSSGFILKKLVPGLKLRDTEVLISSIELGSYKDNFIIRMVFGDGETAEKKIEDLRKTLRLDSMTPKRLIVLVMLGVIIYVAYICGSSKKVPPHVEESFAKISAEFNLNQQQLTDLIKSAIQDDEVKKSVIRLVHPDGATNNGTIVIDGQHDLAVTSDVVKLIPSKFVKADDTQKSDDLENVLMIVRAVDLDKANVGWAAVVPSVSTNRIQMQVLGDVDRNKIPVGKNFYGNVTVLYGAAKDGTVFPRRYILSAITPDKP
jgi:hypothetical protein